MSPRPQLDTATLLRIPQQRFHAVAAAAITVLALLFAAYGALDRHELIEQGVADAEQMADQTALAADGALESSRQLLRAMALLVNPPVTDPRPNPAAVRERLQTLRGANPHVMDLLIIDANGRITDWTGSGPPPSIVDREYYRVHLESGSGLYVGPPLLSKVHLGQWFFALSEALRDDTGRLTHVVVVIVDVVILRERLAIRHFQASNTQALLTPDGRVYSRTPDHSRYVGQKVSRPDELGRLTPERPFALTIASSQLDQQERIIAFRRLANYPVVAVATVSLSTQLAPWRQRLVLVALLWLAISIGIVLLARRGAAISAIQAEHATLDSLTGVLNRRSIMTSAMDLERAKAPTAQLSLLMIDIDHFKSINDSFGHLAGDAAIRQVSDLLRTEVRASDLVGRYGGEEFLILMPETDATGAARVAEKLRSTIAARIVQPVPITVSIGVATMGAEEHSLERTLARADAALYEAKQAGRNTVRVAAESAPTSG